jgi:2-succinyl-6-hydroxy-2,4-cyclohexadiene-1-carboxylate synthase
VLWAEREGSGPRLALVHGFTQTGACWGPVADDLAVDHEVVRIDAPGHGRSTPVAADLVATADLLAEVGGTATWIGYSMGGRACLHLALRRPEAVRALVLLGATAGIEDPGERAARVAADELLARRLEADGLEPFLDDWLALPLFAGLTPEAQHRQARLANEAPALATSLRLAGTGAQEPLWDRLGEVAAPVLVVAGERDERFAATGARMAAAIGPHAEVRLVPGAGHAAHLEQPQAFLDVVRPWLAAHER